MVNLSPMTTLPLACLALLLGGPVAAGAADLIDPPPRYAPYEPPAYEVLPPRHSYAPPVWRERLVRVPERCRVIQRTWIDYHGREVIRHVRVCQELPAYGAGWAAWAPPPARYDEGPRFYQQRGPMREGPPPEYED
jgi:hypothetical protein